MTQPNAVVTVTTPKGGAMRIGNAERLSVIAGPCQLESRQHALETAHALKEIAARLGIGLIYKTSFDKANRSSGNTPRGARPGRSPADLRRNLRERPDRPAGADRRARAGPVRRGRPRPSTCCKIPGLSVAARPICCSPPAPPGGSSMSRRASSWRPGTCSTWSPRCSRPATPTSWPPSAGCRSATTPWSTTCARCRSCAGSVVRSCSTPPIRCSSQAGSGEHPRRRRARVRAGPGQGAGGEALGVAWSLHGNPPGPDGQRAVRWAEHGAAERRPERLMAAELLDYIALAKRRIAEPRRESRGGFKVVAEVSLGIARAEGV